MEKFVASAVTEKANIVAEAAAEASVLLTRGLKSNFFIGPIKVTRREYISSSLEIV